MLLESSDFFNQIPNISLKTAIHIRLWLFLKKWGKLGVWILVFDQLWIPEPRIRISWDRKNLRIETLLPTTKLLASLQCHSSRMSLLSLDDYMALSQYTQRTFLTTFWAPTSNVILLQNWSLNQVYRTDATIYWFQRNEVTFCFFNLSWG